MKKHININGYNYVYYEPTDYLSIKQYKKQLKQIQEKIRATQYGMYKDTGRYKDYPELLNFLKTLN